MYAASKEPILLELINLMKILVLHYYKLGIVLYKFLFIWKFYEKFIIKVFKNCNFERLLNIAVFECAIC
jgi:hypothetical protein